MTRYLRRSAIGVLLVLGASSCAFEPGAGPDVTALESDACEHMTDGPSESVTASVAAADAPQLTKEHVRYDVSGLADGRYVALTPELTGMFYLFLREGAEVHVDDGHGHADLEHAAETGRPWYEPPPPDPTWV